ncbi:diguanylate cyclase [Rhizobium puerariae]|uniref:diguanylate cyclase n=1 Tax=Rhizobium puerariae TaxID=1585791 RepID=A0ABV6AI09_9HYPH
MKSSSIRTYAGITFGVCGFIGLIVWGEYSSWQSQVTRIEASLTQTARALVQHADDTIEMAKLPLAGTITEIHDEEMHPDMPSKLRKAMKQQIETTPWLDRLSYVDARGDVVATSGDIDTGDLNLADRDYFKFHQSSVTLEPVLGGPIKSRFSREWIFTVSQRVNRQDGSFAGLVIVSIATGQFTHFFENFDVGKDGSFLMVQGEGIILARSPFREDLLGTDISSHDLFANRLKQARSGAYHYISPVDGARRIGGFYQSPRTGIVVLAAASESEALANWTKVARIRWTSGVVVVTITGILFWRWRRQVMLRAASEALLVTREAEFRLLAEGSSDLIQRFNGNGIREYISPSAREIYGLDAEALMGTSILDGLHEDDRETVVQVMERLRTGAARERMVVRRTRADGKQIWLDTTLNRLPGGVNGADVRIVAVSRDVTHQKKIQDELDTLANTDELTQLANRRSLNSHGEEMMLAARKLNGRLSALMLDADHFKLFNDTYGHAAGDECLRAIARVIAGSIRRGKDLAARYGGEEFAVLLPDTDAAGAFRAAENIRRRIAGLRLRHERNLPWGHVTISVGVATFDPAGSELTRIADLFEQADQALYQAKNAGRNRSAAAERVVTADGAASAGKSA